MEVLGGGEKKKMKSAQSIIRGSFGRQGFTLIELLVVMAVLAVIASGVVIAINPGKRIRQANDTKIKNDVGQMATALQAYYTTNQLYPAALSDLVTNGDLKVIPAHPQGGQTYTYSRTGTCTITSCEAQVAGILLDPVVVPSWWCWRSATGQAIESASGCAP